MLNVKLSYNRHFGIIKIHHVRRPIKNTNTLAVAFLLNVILSQNVIDILNDISISLNQKKKNKCITIYLNNKNCNLQNFKAKDDYT